MARGDDARRFVRHTGATLRVLVGPCLRRRDADDPLADGRVVDAPQDASRRTQDASNMRDESFDADVERTTRAVETRGDDDDAWVRDGVGERAALLGRGNASGASEARRGGCARVMVVGALAIGAVASVWVASGDVGAREETAALGRSWPGANYKITCDGDGKWSTFDHNTSVLTAGERAKLASGQTYVNGFWRLPVSHHPASWYLPNLRATACQLGAFAMNTLFVRDDEQMCEYALALYAKGSKKRGEYEFGRGHAACIVNKDFSVIPSRCPAHAKIWYNKMTILADAVKRVEAGEFADRGDLKASNYFWLDGDILSRKRSRFPRFRHVLDMIDSGEDKMNVACYFQDMGNFSRVDHRYHSFHKWWDYAANKLGSRDAEQHAGSADTALLALVSSVPPDCPWMRREMVANIFGGSSRAIGEFVGKYIEFIDKHIPTSANGHRPSGPRRCNCPSEEMIFTTMANDGEYADLFPKTSCAHRVRNPYNLKKDPWARKFPAEKSS